MASETDYEIAGDVWHNEYKTRSNSYASESKMKRSTLFAIGALALVTTACAEPEPEIIASAHIPLTGSEGEDPGTVTDCQPPGGIEDNEIIFQSLFINLADFEEANAPMQLGLMMENRLIDSSTYSPSGHDQNQRNNQNWIEVQGYEITFEGDGFTDTLGPDSNGELRVEATGLIPTDGSLWVGLELFYPNELRDWKDAFQIASGGQGNAIVPTFAEVQVVGETVGGSKVQSNILTVPIQVCNGCSRRSTPICVVE